jgi:hypothetical protein
MKKIIYYLMTLAAFVACKEEERGQYAVDKVPPGQVTDVHAENLPGGALISYTVPKDNDLLYVKVVYTLSDGTKAEQKSSAYTPQVKVEGLGYGHPQTVQLICGDRSGNESVPLDVAIEPLDSPIYDILKSVEMKEDFGGIKVTWDNPLTDNIVLTMSVLDTLSEQFIEFQNVYTNLPAGKYNLRGFPARERVFAVSVRDRWNNRTDVVSGAYTPRFEQQFDPKKFGKWNPPGIPYYQLDASWSIDKLWDGKLADPGFSLPQTVNLPVSITFDMGQTGVLNRIKVYQRTSSSQLYAGYNVRMFQLYGSPTSNVNADFTSWFYMGEFESQKPSGLPLGQISQEDIDYATAGEDYQVEINNDVPVRYIRVHILETWSGGISVGQFYELEFFGQLTQ